MDDQNNGYQRDPAAAKIAPNAKAGRADFRDFRAGSSGHTGLHVTKSGVTVTNPDSAPPEHEMTGYIAANGEARMRTTHDWMDTPALRELAAANGIQMETPVAMEVVNEPEPEPTPAVPTAEDKVNALLEDEDAIVTRMATNLIFKDQVVKTAISPPSSGGTPPRKFGRPEAPSEMKAAPPVVKVASSNPQDPKSREMADDNMVIRTAIKRQARFCPSCGFGFSAIEKFCPECGNKRPDTFENVG
jgi:hypothetical protein